MGLASSFAATAMIRSLLGRASRAQVRKTSVGARSARRSTLHRFYVAHSLKMLSCHICHGLVASTSPSHPKAPGASRADRTTSTLTLGRSTLSICCFSTVILKARQAARGPAIRTKSPGHRQFWYVRTNKAIVAARSTGALRRLLESLVKEGRPLNGVNLATIFHKAAKVQEEVYSPSILAFLTNALSDPDLRLDARQLASCLYGLQSLSTADPEVLRLVDVLATITESFSTSKTFTAQAVSNMLYGLQNLTTDCREVRRLLRALASLLQDFPTQPGPQLSAQGVGALYGLQGMGDSSELRELLRVLTPLVDAARDLDGQAIGNALYGLQSMKSDVLEVRELLEVLARKVTAFDGKLTEQEASNALYGLQFMDPQLDPVKDILAVLSSQVSSSPGAASVGRRGGRLSRHPVNPLEESRATPRIGAGWLGDAFRDADSDDRDVAGYAIDIGCDMGGFARALARARPDLRVVGLEVRPHVVAFANARAQEEGLPNVVFLQGNANVDLEPLLQGIPKMEVHLVTINFPDPHLVHPSHRPRRLLSGRLVQLLADTLGAGREVLFQSDVTLLTAEAEAAFCHGGCFKALPWVDRQDFPETERQVVVQKLGLPIFKARLVRTDVAVAMTLQREVDGLLSKMRSTG
eukprot:s3254_g4.t1